MNQIKFLVFLISVAIFFSCDQNQPENMEEIEVTEKTAQLIKAQNDFGFELIKKVYSSEKNSENIMISPLSVSLALAMTYNGAADETKTAMEKTLKVHGLSPDEINTSYRDLVAALKLIDTNVLFEIANSIYYRNTFKVEDKFISTNRNYYDAEISALDFNSSNAVKTINNWVAKKTHDKITSIIDEITPAQVMFLLNAIYFKGIWQKEFNKKNTTGHLFVLENGKIIQTQMMVRTDTLPYLSNDLFSAVKLGYGKGNFNMFLFLPQPGKNVKDILDEMNKTTWEAWIEEFNITKDVDIRLPKLKYGFEFKLNDVLTEMGMGVAFTGAANFTGINKAGGLYIEYVKHKTFIEVNEEGTEAAAVTIVAIDKTSAGPQKTPFYLNKPFLFAITEKDTGAILFMGTVKNPNSSQL